RPPFYSEGFGDLVNLHLNTPPPPPRTVNPGVPEAVEAIILKALAKAPEQRFASMEEMQQAIKGASDGTFTVRGVSRPELVGGTSPVMPTPSGTVSLPVAS